MVHLRTQSRSDINTINQMLLSTVQLLTQLGALYQARRKAIHAGMDMEVKSITPAHFRGLSAPLDVSKHQFDNHKESIFDH